MSDVLFRLDFMPETSGPVKPSEAPLKKGGKTAAAVKTETDTKMVMPGEQVKISTFTTLVVVTP